MTERAHHSAPFGNDNQVEAEYDRLRDLARACAQKRGRCFEASQEAYRSGDGARAKQLSEEGKRHDAEMDRWNKAASDFIFLEENRTVPSDTIDLHGQFAEEAENIVELAIRERKGRGEPHLRVIVGKGNHSKGGVMKVRPRVEQVCRELGLSCRTEENEGILFVDLSGGEAGQSYGGHQQEQEHHARPHGQGQQQHRPQHQQQDQGNDELEKLAAAVVPKVMKKLEKACCIMM